MLQADGGTRTAAITGSYVALYQALAKLCAAGLLPSVPLTDSVAAISCGVFDGAAVLDLDYAEDSQAMTDANFVLTGSGRDRRNPGDRRGRAVRRGPLCRDAARWPALGIAELTRHQRAALGLG